MFFAPSDWLLKLGIAFAIDLPAFLCMDFAREFCFISQKKRNFLLLAIHWFGTY